MKTMEQLAMFLSFLLLLSSCEKVLQMGTEEEMFPVTRTNMEYTLILGAAPNPTSSLTGYDMQLCLNNPLSEDLYIQLSVRPKNKFVIERELAGSNYRIPAGQKYVNIQLPIVYEQKSDTTFSLVSLERIPVIATIKYLTYKGSEDIWYSTIKYLVTYNPSSGEEVIFKVISDDGFVNFRFSKPQPDPVPDPNKPDGPRVLPGLPTA